MAKAKAKTTLNFEGKITLELTEPEARALNEMTKYGIAKFLLGYRKQLGSYYIDPHVTGLTSLFETIDESLPEELEKLKNYRVAIYKADQMMRGDDGSK